MELKEYCEVFSVVFTIGSALGVTGLIIKPVTGVLDAASKTAEGISNMATNMDEKPN
jgi:vacuolar protein sorting-associated protein 13A/C